MIRKKNLLRPRNSKRPYFFSLPDKKWVDLFPITDNNFGNDKMHWDFFLSSPKPLQIMDVEEERISTSSQELHP